MHLALSVHRHMPYNRERGGRYSRLFRALGRAIAETYRNSTQRQPPLAVRATGRFTGLHTRTYTLAFTHQFGRDFPGSGRTKCGTSPEFIPSPFLSRITQPLSLLWIVCPGGASDALGVSTTSIEQAPVHRGPAFTQDHHLDHGDNGRRILLQSVCANVPWARNLAPFVPRETSDLSPSRSAKVREVRSISNAAAPNVACRRSSAHDPTSRPASLTVIRSPRCMMDIINT